MNIKRIRQCMNIIDKKTPRTFQYLAQELNTTERRVRATVRYLNSLRITNYRLFQNTPNGIIRNGNSHAKQRIEEYFKFNNRLKDKRYRKAKKENDLKLDFIEEYHKNKTCKTCKGRLELSRYYECTLCRKTLREIGQEFIDAGW